MGVLLQLGQPSSQSFAQSNGQRKAIHRLRTQLSQADQPVAKTRGGGGRRVIGVDPHTDHMPAVGHHLDQHARDFSTRSKDIVGPMQSDFDIDQRPNSVNHRQRGRQCDQAGTPRGTGFRSVRIASIAGRLLIAPAERRDIVLVGCWRKTAQAIAAFEQKADGQRPARRPPLMGTATASGRLAFRPNQ